MDASASEIRAPDDDLARRDARNWAYCIGILATVLGLSVYLLATAPSAAPATTDSMSSGMLLGYNACMAVCGLAIQLHLFSLPPIEVRYTVMDRPEIPIVAREFSGFGHWVYLTHWSNTLGVVYFCLAVAVGILQRGQGHVPLALARATGLLWEIVFPISFMNNIVVTNLIIPGMRKEGNLDKIQDTLKWYNQAKHNGFVLAASVEAVLASPPMHPADAPIIALYSSCYVLFALLLFKRLRVFMYFFFDPRFKFAPIAYAGLISTLLAVYGLCCAASMAASEYWVLRPMIVLAALATCTFRDAGSKVD